MTTTEERILEALDQDDPPTSYRELSEETGYPISTLRDAFMALRRRRLAKYTPGRHNSLRITDKGREAIK